MCYCASARFSSNQNMEIKKLPNEEAKARSTFTKFSCCLTEIAVIKCAIDLAIPDILENHMSLHGSGMTVAELSVTLGSSPPPLLRVMKFLTHHGIFNEVKTDKEGSLVSYVQTPLSRLLMKTEMAPFLQYVASPTRIDALWGLSKFLTTEHGEDATTFEAVHGMDLWRYMEANPSYMEVFNNGMSSHSRFIISMVVENYKAAFEGVATLVDVGGGNGTVSRALVKACSWIIRAINFDLPHVVVKSSSEGGDRVEYVGGDMFVSIPKADAVLMVAVLHDWGDEACVKILKNCKKAIPNNGKVIIVNCVVEDDDDNSPNEGNEKREHKSTHLAMDIQMLGVTGGKQRTRLEWANIINAAGFRKHTIKNVQTYNSVIVAYP